MKHQTGIWINQRKAILITFLNGEVEVRTIVSNVENYYVVGSAHFKIFYGPMDVVSEKEYLERHNYQLNKYFQKILNAVKNVDELYIFGPEDTKYKLLDVFNKNKELSLKVRNVETVDSMTERQMIAWARKAFELKIV